MCYGTAEEATAAVTAGMKDIHVKFLEHRSALKKNQKRAGR